MGQAATSSAAKTVVGSILQQPSWYAEVQRKAAEEAGDTPRFVDFYTMMQLVREHERQRAAEGERWRGAVQVEARPGGLQGLAPVYNEDGVWQDAERGGVKCWRVPAYRPPGHLYFGAAGGFHRLGSGPLEVVVQYLDDGKGRFALQYDSTDTAAAMEGIYRGCPNEVTRTGAGDWCTVAFRLPDARFENRQNGGADLRLFNDGDDLLVRSEPVRRAR